MIHRIICLLVLLVGVGGPHAGAQTVISGQVLGADGEVMPVTHVLVYPYAGSRQPFAVKAAPEGRYQIEILELGPARVEFAGPLHAGHQVVILIEDAQPVELDVQLQRTWMDRDQSFTRVVTQHTGFDYEQGAVLEEQDDGSFAATVEAPGDTLIYGLPGASSQAYQGWVFDAITADAFVYTRDGYRARVASPADQVRVTVRPRRLGTPDPPRPVTTFGPANRRAAAFWAYYQALEESQRYLFTRALRAGRTFDDAAARDQEARDRENALRQEILALEIDIEKETDAFRRDLLLMLYLSRTSGMPFWRQGVFRSGLRFGFDSVVAPNPAYVTRALAVIPPTSMGWAAHPVLLQMLIEATDGSEAALAYVETVVATHPLDGVRRLALFNLLDGLFAREGRSPRVAAYVEQYQQTFGAEDDLLEDWPSGPFEAASRVAVGRRAPDWISGPGVTPWPDSLADTVVLLDFWAASCADCVQGEATLREAHRLYSDDGLNIVRVSLDRDAPSEHAEASPWHRYQGEDGFKSGLALSFNVSALPRRVLIDRDGVILALDGDLQGDRLLETLGQVFGK
jgi:hypothetical protein